MRSLFLKIFLWFGLTMVLVNAASFVMGVIGERRFQPQRPSTVAPMLGLFAETAAEILDRAGKNALAAYLERIERASEIHAVLLDENGNEITGRSIPRGAIALSRAVNDNFPFLTNFPPPAGPDVPFLAAQSVRSATGARYVLVGELPRNAFPRPPPRLGDPESLRFGGRLLAQHFLPILLVGGLFCYFLSRYLTTPVIELRKTTQQLARGDLKARVNSKLLSRHDDLGYLGRDFNLMAGRIESLVEAQRRLLGDISHELRSPLARQGVALAIARRHAGPEITGALDRIEREAERLNEMIGQLLTLSRVEVGTGGFADTEVDLAELLRQVAADGEFEARSRNRAVRVSASESCITFCAPELLSSAIENVIRNAVRHTAPNTEVEITLRRESIGTKEVAIIEVRDHGPGLPEAALEDIFRPFYRVEDARDRKTGGTGLGLAIAARAVRLHGGSITARNVAEGGLTVEIRLPLRNVPEQAPTVQANASL